MSGLIGGLLCDLVDPLCKGIHSLSALSHLFLAWLFAYEEFSHLGMADLGSSGLFNLCKIWVLLFLLNLFLWGLDFRSFSLKRGFELLDLGNGFSYFPKVASFFWLKLTCDDWFSFRPLLWFWFLKVLTGWYVLSSVTLISFWNICGGSDLNPFFFFLSAFTYPLFVIVRPGFQKKGFSFFIFLIDVDDYK